MSLRTWMTATTSMMVVLACSGPESAGDGSRSEAPAPWFVEVVDSGLDFHHETGAEGSLLAPEIMGAGVALFDADGDGDLDAYLVNGSFALRRSPPAGEGPLNRLYLQGGDGRFRDATVSSGLGDPGYGMGVAVGDVDNDGDRDVYVTNYGDDRLYRNRGDGTFEDVTEEMGIAVGGWSSSAAFCDLDRDGDLDLYVARYVRFDPGVECHDAAGRREFCGPESFADEQDVLLRNLGGAAFRDDTMAAGIDAVTGAGLGVVCDDFDGDGWIDLYVANDADPNQLWINQTDGTFRDEALVRGASVNAQGRAEAGMGVVAADFDNDRNLDLFMTHLEDESNTLYRNLGGTAGFEDATAPSGLQAPSMRFTGFGTAAFDADQDGDLDLVVVNGRVKRSVILGSELPEPWNAYAEPNHVYRNRGNGTFEPLAAAEAGELGGGVEVSRGLAVGDVDGDGALDVLVSNAQGPARLYRNQAATGHWLGVEPFDPALGRLAVGSVVRVRAGGREQVRTACSAMSYLSSSDARPHFGLGDAGRVDEIVVRWPDGVEERFAGGPADRWLRVVRGEGAG